MRRVPTSQFPFYVYDILDPRTDRVFYVGCGTGRRIRTTINPENAASRWKRGKLESIIRAGHKPVANIVQCFATRPEALVFERDRQIRFRLVPEAMEQFIPIEERVVARRPVSSWCGHPNYDRPCRFLPQYCVPRIARPESP